VARSAGGTVNDAFVAALLAGMRRYHERHGLRLDTLRLGVPISTRSGDSDSAMRNQFAPVRLVVPLQEPDPTARMRAVHALVGTARREAALTSVEPVAAVALRVPALRAVLAAAMRSIDVVASNVPGLDVPLYLRGARVLALVPFGPRGAAALNATVLSYDGTLHLGLNIDTAAVADHDVLVDCLRLGLAETVGA
jgi:diacylglycerol O-acyltransferase